MRKVLTNSKNNNLIRYLDLMLVFMVNQMSNQLTLHAMKCQAPRQVNLLLARKHSGSSLSLTLFFFSNPYSKTALFVEIFVRMYKTSSRTLAFQDHRQSVRRISRSHSAGTRMPTAQVYHPVFFRFTPKMSKTDVEAAVFGPSKFLCQRIF